jgi:hypothetical protein
MQGTTCGQGRYLYIHQGVGPIVSAFTHYLFICKYSLSPVCAIARSNMAKDFDTRSRSPSPSGIVDSYLIEGFSPMGE